LTHKFVRLVLRAWFWFLNFPSHAKCVNSAGLESLFFLTSCLIRTLNENGVEGVNLQPGIVAVRYRFRESNTRRFHWRCLSWQKFFLGVVAGEPREPKRCALVPKSSKQLLAKHRTALEVRTVDQANRSQPFECQ